MATSPWRLEATRDELYLSGLEAETLRDAPREGRDAAGEEARGKESKSQRSPLDDSFEGFFCRRLFFLPPGEERGEEEKRWRWRRRRGRGEEEEEKPE